VQAKAVQRGPRPPGDARVDLDGGDVGSAEAVAEQRGGVAGTGADLQDAFPSRTPAASSVRATSDGSVEDEVGRPRTGPSAMSASMPSTCVTHVSFAQASSVHAASPNSARRSGS
jgi:hypothetical protein